MQLRVGGRLRALGKIHRYQEKFQNTVSHLGSNLSVGTLHFPGLLKLNYSIAWVATNIRHYFLEGSRRESMILELEIEREGEL